MPTIIILVVVAIVVFYILGFYNKLKTLQVRIKASIQEIGNQLKRQANLIPNLVESVKSYMSHEKGIYEEIVSARKTVEDAANSGDMKKIEKSQDAINKVLSSLKVIVESNPELKASNLVSDLMNELRDTADKLMYSRRTLIDLSADYNVAITTIPGVWFAGMFGFTEEKGLATPTEGSHIEVSEEEMKDPKVNL